MKVAQPFVLNSIVSLYYVFKSHLIFFLIEMIMIMDGVAFFAFVAY